MDSFDQTVIKAREAFSSVYKKTGEVINIQKQRFALASMCSDLEKLYAELGRLHYKKTNGQAVDAGAEELIFSDIKEQLKAMKALKDDIDKAEGKFACPVCGAKVPAKSRFCNSCGASFDNIDSEF